MCEKYKITINQANENLEVEGSNREWVEGNAKQFLEKLTNNNLVIAKFEYVIASVISGVLAVLSLVLFSAGIFTNDIINNILWCSFWSFFGISACLFNIRSGGRRGVLHFLTYYPFVFVVIVLLSLSSYYHALPRSYELARVFSAFLALLSGFISYKLLDVALGYLKSNK